MKIGLALSGGGARGVAHIGVIKALEELGLTFSCISGTSAGAIVGALYAYGHTPDQILEIIKRVTIFNVVRPAWTWSGLLTMEGMGDLLLKRMPENDFKALKIPLTVVATEIRLGETHYFSDGELVRAIMASCTVPAVFTPLSFRGGHYVDGGVLDNLPVKPLTGHCDLIVGSHCNHFTKDFDPRNMKVVAERALLIAIQTNTLVSKRQCDVLIEPPGLARFSGFDIAKAQEIFDFAYRFTRENFSEKAFAKAVA